MVNCGPLTLLPYSLFVFNEGSMFDQTLEIQCFPGFEPQDIVYLTCQANGSWDEAPPNCSAGTVNNINITNEQLYHFNSCIYYSQIGQNSSVIIIIISDILCPEPVNPMDGTFVYGTPVQMAHVGSIILYNCDFGYSLVGDSMAECLPTGQWSTQVPKCEQGSYWTQ